MKLYHSSTVKVEHPDLKHSRDYLDFGKGFYLTSLKEQAILYAERFLLRGQTAVLNEFEVDDDFKDLNVKVFEAYDEEWLEFVLECRQGKDKTDYDLVIGGIANDKIFRTIDLYFSGDITKDEALRRLKYEKPNNQYCFRTIESIKHLTFSISKQLLK
ncbi:MAG: DUF3990 domain-containing protein [Candidatus Cryptobacteroides sp.]